jgi:hypothetical protein
LFWVDNSQGDSTASVQVFVLDQGCRMGSRKESEYASCENLDAEVFANKSRVKGSLVRFPLSLIRARCAYLKFELDFVRKMIERKRVLLAPEDSSPVEAVKAAAVEVPMLEGEEKEKPKATEMETSMKILTSLAIPRVILKQACKTISKDVGFRSELIQVLRESGQTAADVIIEEMYKSYFCLSLTL